MATPITHIVLTEKIYKKYFGDCNKREVFLGTILPDIRYIDSSISKESTHQYNITLKEIQLFATCFDKGIYFHSLLDRVRDEFYISRGIYTFGGDEDFIVALKFLEDQYLYTKIKDRNEYTQFFDHIPYDKISNIKKESLDKRYTMIKQETIVEPNDTSRRAFQINLGLSEEYTNRINNLIHKLEHNEKILHLIDELYESFGSLITK